MTEKCMVCDKESNNLRKHCVGKWLNDPEDVDHLIVALELTPSSLYYLKNHYLQQVEHERGEDSIGTRETRGENDKLDVVVGRIIN